MNDALRIGYEGAARLARALSTFAPSSGNKLVETFASRRGVVARYEAFARDRSRPLLWIHAASVGEGLQARPVIDLAHERLPHVQLAYTYFSPSAEEFANRLPVDFRAPLPFDVASDMRRALGALAPNAIVFSKLDVWPTLAREASLRGTRLALLSATLARGSSRRSGLARALLRDAYARLDRVGAISRDDADRLIALGVPSSRVTVTGDTRYDQVWERARAKNLFSPLLRPLASDRPTLVAGSTWPADEAVLLPAWLRLRDRVPTARLIIAPHEPNEAHLAPIERWSGAAGLPVARLSGSGASEASVVLIDRVGVLGELYALATVAFVGGGFHAAGLHSVLEPAAFGVPVLFGPNYRDVRDAGLLLDADGAKSASDVESMSAALESWLVSKPARAVAGAAATEVVRRGRGAAERSFALVAGLIGI